jgi:hypothetical protein
LGTTYLNGRHLHRDDVELLLLGVTTFATRLPCCVFAVDPNRSILVQGKRMGTQLRYLQFERGEIFLIL